MTVQFLLASEKHSNERNLFLWLAVQGYRYPVQCYTHTLVLVPKIPLPHHPLRLMY